MTVQRRIIMVISKWEWNLIIRLPFWGIPLAPNTVSHFLEKIARRSARFITVWPSTHRTYSNHNVNVQNTSADETSRAECIQPPWCLLLRDALPERRWWTSGGKFTSRSLQNCLSWSLCQNIVRSQCRFLVTSADCYVRKSHLQRGLLSLMKEVLLSSW